MPPILRRREFRPREFTSGPATVAVDTSDIAFLDLRQNSRPTHRDHHLADLGQLLVWIAMIEFKHDRICPTAVDARMGAEVGHHVLAVFNASRLDLCDRSPDVI